LKPESDIPEWQSILGLLKTKNNTLYGVIRMSQADIIGEDLNLSFKFAFHQKRALEAANMSIISNVASEAIGRKIVTRMAKIGGVSVVQLVGFKQPEENKQIASIGSNFYLSELQIRNFRILKDSTFIFQPGLNVLLGANNSGKSAVIDALRYIFNLGNYQKRDDIIRIDDQDIYTDGKPFKNEELIEFETIFLSSDEKVVGQLNDMYDREEDGVYIFRLKHQIIMKADVSLNRHVYKSSKSTGGKDFLNPVSQDSLDFIRSIYLSPLRDIVEDGAKVGMEIERLIRSQVKSKADHEKLNKLPENVRTTVLDEVHQVTGSEYLEIISSNLSGYAKPYFKALAKDLVSFFPSSINKNIYRSMRPIFSHESHGLGGLDLQANGLGLNNLIYASIVLSRISDDSSFRFFMIEEPEAHLHPQIQKTFFSELNKIGNHQVFVTSHSPTITAEVDIDKVILMKRQGDKPVITQLKGIYPVTDPEKFNDKKYLEKFLDVTKSQLLFSDAVIFVEGISEALLLQKFSEIIGRNLRDAGVEIIVLGAKDGFSHFKPLFDANPNWKCAFITDDDCKWEDIRATDNDLPSATSVSPRIYSGVGTFEYELLKTASNSDAADPSNKYRVAKLRETFTKAKSKGALTFYDDDIKLSYKRMKNKAEDNEWGTEGLKSNSYFEKSKSEFAFQLEQSLDNKNKDMIPKYIEEAIKYVTTNE
jgi:putative ATP-dependent endonuclease of OLD family